MTNKTVREIANEVGLFIDGATDKGDEIAMTIIINKKYGMSINKFIMANIKK